MNTWWSRDDSWPTLLAAAGQRGITVDILEKDYWVTQSLRVLALRFPDEFVFKGGTSLSKCYDCIQRFSEDIDILILPGEKGRGAISTLMKSMTSTVVQELPFTSDLNRHKHSTGKYLNDYLFYPTKITGAKDLDPIVLLEMGIRGDDIPPHCILPIEPMISVDLRLAEFDVSEFPDLMPFDVPVLHPGRTLVEKVMMLHSKVTKGLSNPDDQGSHTNKFGRHYHDIHRLLGREAVRQWLHDRDAFLMAVHSHEFVNRKHFDNEVPPRPDGGYAASDAFRPDFIGHQQLAEFYKREMKFLFLGPGDLPPWVEVIDAIQGAADLL